METITVFFIVEIIGTVAFACSGAMVAIKKNLDLLGIISKKCLVLPGEFK